MTFAALANFFEFDLVAHRLDGSGIGADEDDAGVGQRLGEGRPLGEEPVARMHGFRARRLAGRDDLVDDEIGLRRGGRTDGDRFVRHFDVQRVLVGVRVDGDRLDTHFPRRLDDPAGDLAAVGDQYFFEHSAPRGPSLRAFRSGRSIAARRARKRRTRSQGMSKWNDARRDPFRRATWRERSEGDAKAWGGAEARRSCASRMLDMVEPHFSRTTGSRQRALPSRRAPPNRGDLLEQAYSNNLQRSVSRARQWRPPTRARLIVNRRSQDTAVQFTSTTSI